MRSGGALYRDIAEEFGINERTASMWVNDPDGGLDRAKKRREQEEHPERKRASRRRSYDRHRERILEQMRDTHVGEVRDRRNTAARATRARHRDAYVLRRRLARYGLAVDEYQALRDAQAGWCGICGRSMDGPGNEHIDHCHATGVVRALLCHRCNTALGLVREDRGILAAMGAYLDRHGPDN
jgi:hypothetical protein